VVLRALIDRGPLNRTAIAHLLAGSGLPASDAHVESAVRTLTLDFGTAAERTSVKDSSLVEDAGERIELSGPMRASYSSSSAFRAEVDDLLRTATRVVIDRYDIRRPFTPGRQYSRKDASRLLCWPGNVSSTIYGYKVDRETETCPIFVTLHKSDDVSS